MKERMFVWAIAALASLNATPALAAGKIYYGSRAGMTVTIISMSGLNGPRAVIKTKHTREDAIDFCREYVGKVTPKCVAEELETRLSDEITANCLTGKFTDFGGQELQFLGKLSARADDISAKYGVRNVSTGEIADGSMASGYPTYMGIFSALCPAKVPLNDY